VSAGGSGAGTTPSLPPVSTAHLAAATRYNRPPPDAKYHNRHPNAHLVDGRRRPQPLRPGLDLGDEGLQPGGQGVRLLLVGVNASNCVVKPLWVVWAWCEAGCELGSHSRSVRGGCSVVDDGVGHCSKQRAYNCKAASPHRLQPPSPIPAEHKTDLTYNRSAAPAACSASPTRPHSGQSRSTAAAPARGLQSR